MQFFWYISINKGRDNPDKEKEIKKMKNANQMKEITYKHSKIIQWVEETLSAEIEKAAEAGSREYGFKIPTIYYDLTKDETYLQT